MPRQFGKTDVSVTWQPCPRCWHRHPAVALCVSPGVWMVLALCPTCNPKTGRYCQAHGNRTVPPPKPLVLVTDVRELAAGQEGDEG